MAVDFAGRREDARLLTGQGRYTADWSRPGQAHAVFLRAERAHARIRSIDVADARAAPGVLCVLTGADAVAAGFNRGAALMPVRGRGEALRLPPRPALATDRVRFVGEPLAVVVAETAHAASDAAELIALEYDDLPVVADLVVTATRTKEAVEFVMLAAGAAGGVVTLEASRTPGPALHAAVVLLQAIVQAGAGPMLHRRAQHGADRAGVGADRRSPPLGRAATLPALRNNRIQPIAIATPTPNRSAAPRRASTAATTRLRRSSGKVFAIHAGLQPSRHGQSDHHPVEQEK